MRPELLFKLPDEEIFSPLFQSFPCRETQIRTLVTLLYPLAAPCRNIVVYGVEATGKSSVTSAVLEALSSLESANAIAPAISYASINSVECVTARHLFEKTVEKVRNTIGENGKQKRCESLAQLVVELGRLLNTVQRPSWRFVLVFDAIDRQRDAPHTLLPALARLSEIIPCLTTVFIMTCPPPLCLHEASTIHLHFPNYTKQELISIINSTQVPEPIVNTTENETRELWPRFCGAVHDALIRSASRTLPSFSIACQKLWPPFTAPIVSGNYTTKDFSRLLIAARVHFQDESILDPGVIRKRISSTIGTKAFANGTITQPLNSLQLPQTPSRSFSRSVATTPSRTPGRSIPGTPSATTPGSRHGGITVTSTAYTKTDLVTLPTVARILLVAAYLASHNQSRHDTTLFCTHYTGRKRRRGGGRIGGSTPGRRSKHRKIARKLLGAHAFVMERMLAIFAAVRNEWVASKNGNTAVVDGDVGMAVSTLASLRLLVKIGAAGGDPMDRGGKWRVNVGWEVVRGVGRSLGVEVEEWLVD